MSNNYIIIVRNSLLSIIKVVHLLVYGMQTGFVNIDF